MKELYIARHGQDIDNSNGILNGRRDQPLTELGIAQARNLGEEIRKAGLKFEQIYSSPLTRAYTTAKIVSEIIDGPEPTVLENLIERDFGILTGKPFSDIPKYSSKILKAGDINYFLEAEGVELIPDLLKRVRKVLSQIIQNESPLIVAHGDVGKMLYAAYYDLSWEEVLKGFHFGNADLLYLAPDQDPKDSHKFKFEQHNL